MKYIWIVMLIIIYVIWFIASFKDFIKTARQFKTKYILDSLEEYTLAFILFHLLGLFCYSLVIFLKQGGY